jgi:hypothetical protein
MDHRTPSATDGLDRPSLALLTKLEAALASEVRRRDRLIADLSEIDDSEQRKTRATVWGKAFREDKGVMVISNRTSVSSCGVSIIP